jgi:hypothetical protein
MAPDLPTSITRRSLVAGLALSAAPVALAGADDAHAQAKEPTKEPAAEKSLYERLGGVFAIAAVVDHFSDAVVKNPVVGQKSKNPRLREWHTKNLKRLSGLKFMRTLWVCDVRVGPLNSPLPSPARRLLVWRRPIGISGSPRPSSMRSQPNLDERSTSPRFRNERRLKYWQPLPPTRTRSRPATSRPPSAAEAAVLPSPDDPAQPKLVGKYCCDPRDDRLKLRAVVQRVCSWHKAD